MFYIIYTMLVTAVLLSHPRTHLELAPHPDDTSPAGAATRLGPTDRPVLATDGQSGQGVSTVQHISRLAYSGGGRYSIMDWIPK